MIKYTLRCECEAEFEGWFPDSKAFTKQKKLGQIQCPMCDSSNVDKAIMAPNVKRKSTKQIRDEIIGKRENMIMGGRARNLLRMMQKEMKEKFENVGSKFADEARKADRGERNDKIYGTCTNKEANQLIEEGIDLFEFPDLKDN